MRFSLLPLLLVAAGALAQQPAEFKVALGTDPADPLGQIDSSANIPLAASLTNALHRHVVVKTSSFLTEVMRATRTLENDVLIGPASVTASAVSHGYELVARDDRSVKYVLVAKAGITSVDGLAGKRLYLSQQDSPRAYLARGMLREANFSTKKLAKVTYGTTSEAGLMAVQFNLADATFGEAADVSKWMAAHPGIVTILKTTKDVPAGLGMAVKKTMPASDRQLLMTWVASPGAKDVGLGHLRAATSDDKAVYTYIASLGVLTPASLEGAKLADARVVTELMRKGAIAVDTRSKKEFDSEHVTGAIFAPYVEHSLKEAEFDNSLDDFSAIMKLPHDKPIVFMCNGPECWKSYKASRVALSLGYKEVYWFRGGVPEWRNQSLPLTRGNT